MFSVVNMGCGEAIRWLHSPEPCLVFAGAGISIPSPSCAPSVPIVIRATIDTIVDSMEISASLGVQLRGDAPYAHRLLPESCHSAIAMATGSAQHLNLWGSYTVDSADLDSPQPNVGHYTAATLAFKHHLPILTTNFDQFFELACATANIPHSVGLPKGARFRTAEPPPGGVAIWKLHGSADSIETVRSQAADLARASYSALDSHRLRKCRRLLVIGYSGRDFDIFPWLASYAQAREVLWVDMNFTPNHRAYSLAQCFEYEGSFEDLARQAWLSEESRWPQNARPSVRMAIDVPVGQSAHVRELFRSRTEGSVIHHVRAVLGGNRGFARTALAATLNAATDFPNLIRLMNEDIGVALSPVDLLLLSFALESNERHVDAESAALSAREAAVRNRLIYRAASADLAYLYARARRFSSILSATVLGPQRRRVAFRSRITAFALIPLVVVAYISTRRARATKTYYAASDFLADYIEHIIREAAGLDLRLRSSRLGPAVALRRSLWKTLGAVSSRIGYIRGVLNVRKYLARTGIVDPAVEASLSAAVLGDGIAGAIASRDIGLQLIGQAERAVGPDRQALRLKSQEMIIRSVRLAEEAGNPTLVLVGLLVLKRSGLALPPTRDPLEVLIGRLQGEADVAAAEKIRSELKPSRP